MQLRTEQNKLTTTEYQSIRETTDWCSLKNDMVEKALKNDLFSISVYDKDKLIGIGRVIGDGAIYFYLQDIIVIPEYQNKGIGLLMMEKIEEYFSIAANSNSFIGLMAAKDVKEFYEKFGYKVRPSDRPGMYKMV